MPQEILEIVKKIYQKGKDEKLIWIDNIKWDDKIILNLAKLAKSEISPICSFLGGMAAQEIIKFTGKFTPINQWFWFEFFEILENLPENIDKSLKNSRYDVKIAIFGREMQNKIFDTNIFIVGAGALECEFLKNFALMGFAINENKNVIVTDNDNIEISNVNRQFYLDKVIWVNQSLYAHVWKRKKLNNILIVQIDNRKLVLKMKISIMKNFGQSKIILLTLLIMQRQEGILINNAPYMKNV